MGLPKLARLPALPKAKLPTPARLPQEKEPEIVVVAPFYSTWEIILHAFLLKQHPDWVPQVQQGGYGEPGSTSADELNDTLKIALYLDGPVHTFRFRTGRDELIRAQWRGLGYRLVVWEFTSLAQMKRQMPTLYRRDVEGL